MKTAGIGWWVGAMACAGLCACGDSVGTTDTRASDAAPDGSDTAPDSALDTTPDSVDTGSDAADDTVAPVDSMTADYGPIHYAEVLLPVTADFDPDWQDFGDAVVTTLVETLRVRHGEVSHQDPDGALRVPVDDIGVLTPQPGEPHRLRDQLAITPVDWTPGALPATARSMAYMLALADPQLVDQDSPAQVSKNASRSLAGVTLPAYTPQGEFGPMLDDALVRTADRFQDPRRYDVVIVAGDHIENSQGNELTQLHSVLVGGEVSSDSGARDDVVPGPGNDAFDPFIAGGFRAGTPWISTIGNHDVNIEGNFPVGLVHDLQAPEIRQQLDDLSTPFGVVFPYEPTADEHPALFPDALRSAFRVDPDAFHPAMMTSDDELQSLVSGPTPADPTRAPLGVCGFITRTHAAAGAPAGHGFTQANADDCTGFYTYDPIADVPLRIVSLDLGPHEGGSNGILAPPYHDGAVDESERGDPTIDQLAFLKAELARAEADGVAVIVISHQASDAMVAQSQLQDFAFLLATIPDLLELIDRWSPVPPEATTPAQLRKILSDSPSVIAHIAGHNHRHRVRAICPDGSALAEGEGRCAPGEVETGYWEITTTSGIDFPHGGRIVEIVRVGDRDAALYSTVIEPRIPAGSFSEHGRFVSVAREELAEHGFNGPGEVGDRNLLLPLRLSEAVAARWAGLGAERIESETSLLESKPPLPPLPVWPTP